MAYITTLISKQKTPRGGALYKIIDDVGMVLAVLDNSYLPKQTPLAQMHFNAPEMREIYEALKQRFEPEASGNIVPGFKDDWDAKPIPEEDYYSWMTDAART